MMDDTHIYNRYALSDHGTPLVEISTFWSAEKAGLPETDPRLRELPGKEGKWFLFAVSGPFFNVPEKKQPNSDYWLGGYGSLPNRRGVAQIIQKSAFDEYVAKLTEAKKNTKQRQAEERKMHREQARDRLKQLGLRDEEIAAIMQV